jgi:hypothetical protein
MTDLKGLVKPLVWHDVGNCWEAKTPIGTYSVGFDDGWWAELSGPSMWEWEAPINPRAYDGPSAAMLACKVDYEARLLAALDLAKVEALVKAAEMMVKAYREESDQTIKAFYALEDALAAMKEGGA